MCDLSYRSSFFHTILLLTLLVMIHFTALQIESSPVEVLLLNGVATRFKSHALPEASELNCSSRFSEKCLPARLPASFKIFLSPVLITR